MVDSRGQVKKVLPFSCINAKSIKRVYELIPLLLPQQASCTGLI